MLQLAQSSLWFQVAIVLTWLGLVAIAAGTLHRRLQAGPELVRKVIHMGVGNVILLAWWLQIPAWLGMSASMLFSLVALLSYRLPILPVINTVGRKSLGTFFYALSFAVLIAWFWPVNLPHYAALGILIMTWGDGAAALVGQRFGRNLYKLWGMQKTWEGSAAMAVVSYGVSVGVLWGVQGHGWQTWIVPLGVAIAATTLEAFSRLGVDNLTVPLGSAALAFWLNQLLMVGI
jgi:phytol kinase